MVFNGLTGSDLVVFNALYQFKDLLPKRIPSSDLVRLTGYHHRTVQAALCRLDQYQVIRRRREAPGMAYIYYDIDDYDFPYS